MLTLRWFGLALILPALLLLTGALPFLLLPAVAYGAGLLILTLADRRNAGSMSQFQIIRLHDNKLSLGVQNPIRLEIHSSANRSHKVIVRDEPPLNFVISDSATAAITLDPVEKTGTFVYHATPLQRGNFQFGNITLRWSGVLALYTRQTSIPAAEEVKVYPNIYEIRQYELLVRRDQLSEMGVRTVRLRDEGTVFENLRDYTPDDPYKSINWKATARRGKPIATDYEPERNQRVLICLDVGRMMRSVIRLEDANNAVVSLAKVDFVINTILLLSYVASRKGDQVGLLVFADRVKHYIPPAPGKQHFHKLLETMYALVSEPVEADYEQAVNYLRAKQKKRSLVVLFTDLSGTRATERLLTNLPRLVPQHLPLLVTIRDPLLDREVGQPIVGSDAVYRRMIAERLIEERRLLLDKLRRCGVLTLDVDASHLSVQVVERYLQLKNRLSI